jgi:hypothetical protein
MTYPSQHFSPTGELNGLSLPHALADFLAAKLPWRDWCQLRPDQPPLMPRFTADGEAFAETVRNPHWLEQAAAPHHALPVAVNIEAFYHIGYVPSKALVGNRLLCNLTPGALEVFIPGQRRSVDLGTVYFPVSEFVDFCRTGLSRTSGPIEVIFFTDPQTPGMDTLVTRLAHNIAVTGFRGEVALFTVPVLRPEPKHARRCF